MNLWVNDQLGTYLEFRNGKTSPLRTDKGRFPVYGSNGIIGFSNETNAEADSIVIGRVGTYCGSLYYSSSKAWITDNAIVCTTPEQEGRFWFYALLSLGLNNFRAGSGQPLLNQTILKQLKFVTPPRDERVAIGEILGALDDKIELNRRMNETLEAMARAIFKDWFVDFGPTRAKIEGRAPYLAPDIWSLFPGRLDEEGKPQGWVNSTIGQEVHVVGGSTPSTKEAAFWGGDIAWATPKDLSSLSAPVLLGTERQITDAGLSQIGSGLLPVGTVLLSSRAPIGYMAIAQIPVAVNQGFIAMVCKKRLSNVLVWLWTEANMETVHQNANGSTFQEISKANFRPIEMTIATPEILRAFDEAVVPLFERIVANEKENLTLAAIRDFLLPRLMSGEVRVAHAASLA